MDCRKLLSLAGVVAVALTGCRHQTVNSDPFTPGSASASPSAQTAPEQPQQQPTPSRRRAKEVVAKEPEGKPENLVTIADVQSQIALDESRIAPQRQEAAALAKQYYRRAATLNARYIPAYVGMARLCSGLGDHDQAMAALDEALAKAPNDATIWFERGMIMGRQKHFDEALQCLRRANQNDPRNTMYIKALGLMHARNGQAEEALGWLRNVMSEADGRYNIARMMRHIGQEEEAKRQFQLALKADPNHQPTLTALGYGPAPAPEAEAGPPEPLRLTGHVAEIQTPAVRMSVDAPAPAPAPAPAVADTLPTRPAVEAPGKRRSVQIRFEPNE